MLSLELLKWIEPTELTRLTNQLSGFSFYFFNSYNIIIKYDSAHLTHHLYESTHLTYELVSLFFS